MFPRKFRPNNISAIICQNCTTRARFIDQLSLQAHYAVGGLTVWGVGLALNEVLGPIAPFLLDCYWNGFLFYEYSLNAENICGSHQVSLLAADPLRCLSLGLFIQTAGRLPANILALSNITFSREAQIALDNMLFLFGILHARTLSYPVSLKGPPPKKLNLDPLALSYDVTRLSTNALANKMLSLVRQEVRAPGTAFSFLNPIFNFFQQNNSKPWLKPLSTILLPKELRSLRAFFRQPNINPYAGIFITKLEGVFELIKNLSDMNAVRATRYLIRTPFLSRPMSYLVKYFITKYKGLPDDLVELIIVISKIPHLRDRVQLIIDHLKEVRPRPTDNYYDFWNPIPPDPLNEPTVMGDIKQIQTAIDTPLNIKFAPPSTPSLNIEIPAPPVLTLSKSIFKPSKLTSGIINSQTIEIIDNYASVKRVVQ